MTRNNNSRFAPGSGAYSCRCCGKLTRETGNGESSIQLCVLCYEISGLENMLNDAGHPAYDGLFDNCKTVGEAESLARSEIEKHGLDLDF